MFGAVAFIGFQGCIVPRGWLVEHSNVSFDISPDGQQVVFVSADADLYLLHLRTLQVSQLTKTVAKETGPAFSPDGKSVAYASGIEGRKGAGLFVRSLDGTQVRQLTDEPDASDCQPRYSSDGSHIVFARAHRYRRYSMGGWIWDDWDVYEMKSDGTQLKRGAKTSHPHVSSDGHSVAFISDRIVPYEYDVFIMNQDGTDPRPLGVTKISRYNQNPVFLPGGKSLLFLAGTEWNAASRPIFSLWQVDADGKNPRCVAASKLFTHPLRWKPKQKAEPAATNAMTLN